MKSLDTTNQESGSQAVAGSSKCNVPVGKRFLITIAWAIPIYLIIILFATPKTIWGSGIAGSLIFSLFSGIISMLIPAKHKTVLVSISIFVGIVSALIIGIIVSHNL